MIIGLILYLFYTRWTLQIIQIDKTWVFTVTPPHPLSCPQLPQIASKLCTLGLWQVQCIKYHFMINLALLSDNNFYDTSYSLSQRVIAGSTSFSDNGSGRSNPGVKVFFLSCPPPSRERRLRRSNKDTVLRSTHLKEKTENLAKKHNSTRILM